VTAIRPAGSGISVRVLDNDDRLLLTNNSNKEVIVIGYNGEPYLRFASDGVYRNTRSPATYLNQDRYAQVQVPAVADAHADPVWRKVASGNAWQWHDHRIHWMSTLPPPTVKNAPKQRHHIFDWKVPVRVGGERASILGRLDYAPPKTASPWVYAAIAVPLVAALGAWFLLRRRVNRGAVAT
jgi:hypothetical protein